MSKYKNLKLIGIILIILYTIGIGFFGNSNIITSEETTLTVPTQIKEFFENATNQESETKPSENKESTINLSDIPAFIGDPYVTINDNQPTFIKSDITTKSYEKYSELDSLGRCGVAIACIGKDLMPTEERGSIGQVKPTGWHTVKYDNVDGKYLYNRCHLIGYQLTAENANEKNLITGTRFMNVDGMLPFENMVADYIKETKNHVMYRVTPVFKDNNLVATGVQMEAYSVEDGGEGICFNVYVYNAQPGITIDYATGNSWLGKSFGELFNDINENDSKNENSTTTNNSLSELTDKISKTYYKTENGTKYHTVNCKHLKSSKIEIKYSEILLSELEPCKTCNP